MNVKMNGTYFYYLCVHTVVKIKKKLWKAERKNFLFLSVVVGNFVLLHF